jgi:hypothetical protein
MEGAMDDDEVDKSLIGTTIEAVNDMASSGTDAAKSAATPSEEDKITVMDVPLVADAAAMPMPLVAPKKRKALVKRAPAKTPPKKATAEKAAKKAAKKSAKKSAAKQSKKATKHSPAKKNEINCRAEGCWEEKGREEKESENIEALVSSTLKVRSPEAMTLIDKIKAELKKRAELKAQRMLLKELSVVR